MKDQMEEKRELVNRKISKKEENSDSSTGKKKNEKYRKSILYMKYDFKKSSHLCLGL
jgi:hypothetical protein